MQSGTLPNLTGHIVDDGRLHLLRPIGAGAFGRVYKALDMTSPASSPAYYAVKCLRRPGLRSHDAKFQDRERALHRRVSAHPNILTLHREFTDPKHAFLVLDLCVGGDMFGAIMDGVYHKNTALIKHTFASIIDAVRWCHTRGVYHRDLKPENVLVNYEGGDALIADFGLCTDSEVSHDVDCGSGTYMAPESFGSASTSYRPQDSDTWALCIILINLIAAMNPWHSAQATDHRWNAFMADPDYLREILPISTSLNELLKRCFRIDPARRPTLTELRTEVLAMKDFYMSDADLLRASPGVRRAAGCSPLPLNPQDPSDCSASGTGTSQALDSSSGSGYSSPSGDMRRPLSIAPPTGLAPPHAVAAATGISSLLSVPTPAPSAPKAPFPSTGDVSETNTESSLTPVEHLVQLPDAVSSDDEPPTAVPFAKSSPTPGKFKRFMRRLRVWRKL